MPSVISHDVEYYMEVKYNFECIYFTNSSH